MNNNATTTETTPARSDSAGTVAAVCDRKGPRATEMQAYLAARGLTARWHAPRDLDDVDTAVGAGRLGHVVFLGWSDLLDGIWSGEVTYANWLSAGVKVDFVDAPADTRDACLAAVSQAWDRYRRTQRRRHTIAGLVLSIIAIAVAFAIITLR